jgi:hypothetical protein
MAVRVTLASGNAPKINAPGYVPTGANHTTRHSMVIHSNVVLYRYPYFFFKISLEIFFSIEKWSLSMIECITICAGKQYDFHGNCDYMMAKGAASEPNEKFHVTVQVISIYSLHFRKRWQIFSAKIFFKNIFCLDSFFGFSSGMSIERSLREQRSCVFKIRHATSWFSRDWWRKYHVDPPQENRFGQILWTVGGSLFIYYLFFFLECKGKKNKKLNGYPPYRIISSTTFTSFEKKNRFSFFFSPRSLERDPVVMISLV